MAGASRWADDEADAAEQARKKKEKEEKKRLKLAKQQAEQEAATTAQTVQQDSDSRPAKRRRLSASPEKDTSKVPEERKLLRFEAGGWGPCRHISNFETLNHIEEGSYGWVSRAREIETGEVVALKKVKMDYKEDGFPITALREIQMLQKARHKNIVDLREVVMGDAFDEVVLVMEFLEHDLKTLQEDMPEPFLASEIKTLLRQLAQAVDFLHTNHIMHRDLKTSNVSFLPLLLLHCSSNVYFHPYTDTDHNIRSSSTTVVPSKSQTLAWRATSPHLHLPPLHQTFIPPP